jgi:copper chaperone NosL
MMRIRFDRLSAARRNARLRLAGIVLLAGVTGACGISPEPVHVGSDECAQCRMTISEPQFASQVLSQRGRSSKFDSVECMVAFLNGSSPAAADVHSAGVADFDEPERWVRVEDAFFVHSAALRSPMGGGLSAHAGRAGAESLIAELGSGVVLDWAGVRSVPVTHEHPHSSAAHDAGQAGTEGQHAH